MCSRRSCRTRGRNLLAVNFHRPQWLAVASIAACQPDVTGAVVVGTTAVAVDCKVAPRSQEVTVQVPTAAVDFVGGVGRRLPTAHD